jgi:hypothetical protein
LQLLSLAGLKTFIVELTPTLSVLDNVINFKVFEDRNHILKFFISSNYFSSQVIYKVELGEAKIDIEGVINLKKNHNQRYG